MGMFSMKFSKITPSEMALLVLTLVVSMIRPGICTQRFCITGPPVAESLVFAVMTEQDLAGPGIEFIMWNSPDQARAMIASGSTQASLITTSGAATFYNKGIRVGIAGVFSSALWVVSTDTFGRTPLTGTILFPFGPGEMPGLVFRATMGDNTPTLAVRHTGGAMEAVNRLLMGRAGHALLAEPAASLAVVRSREQNSSPRLFKHMDLRDIWSQKFDNRPLCVSALGVFGDAVDRTDRIKTIISGYSLALEWIKAHPQETHALAVKKFPALAVLPKGRAGCAGIMRTDGEAFDAANFFLEKIFAMDPAALGGILPGPGLFMKPDRMGQKS